MGTLFWIWLGLLLLPLALFIPVLIVGGLWELLKAAIAWCFGAADEKSIEEPQ